MTTIYVEPEDGKNAYNCERKQWIKGVSKVNKTASIIRMLKSGKLKEVKAPKPEKPKS